MIDCGALFPSPPFASLGLAERDCFASLAMTPLTPASASYSLHTPSSRLGLFGGPSPREGPPKVPASKRRVDVAKRTGVRAWVGVIDCGALFPHSLLASLGLAERDCFASLRNDAYTSPSAAKPTRPQAGTFGGPSPREGLAEGPSLEEACGRSETDGGEGLGGGD